MNDFILCGAINSTFNFDDAVKSFHFANDRVERHNKIVRYIGKGMLIGSFIVDKHHPNGREIHNVFDNGIVIIQNERTKKVITEIVARPPQIARYFPNGKMPKGATFAISKARIHQMNGWNMW